MQNKNNWHVIKQVKNEYLSYLKTDALCDLVRVAITNEKKHIKGIIVEAGCALGGSAIALANAKSKARRFFIYDVFGMIPPPSKRDDRDVHERYMIIASRESAGLGEQTYYGYEKKNLWQLCHKFQSLWV